MISANIDNDTRKAVYRRDHYRCSLCDSPKSIQIHHAIPRGQGGDPVSMHNLITLCGKCHALAHGLDIDESVWTPEDVAQEITVYLADLYEPNWMPWKKGREPWHKRGR